MFIWTDEDCLRRKWWSFLSEENEIKLLNRNKVEKLVILSHIQHAYLWVCYKYEHAQKWTRQSGIWTSTVKRVWMLVFVNEQIHVPSVTRCFWPQATTPQVSPTRPCSESSVHPQISLPVQSDCCCTWPGPVVGTKTQWVLKPCQDYVPEHQVHNKKKGCIM